MNMFTKILQRFKAKDVYNYTETISRRQLESFLKLEETNNIKLIDVVYSEGTEQTLLFCSDNIIIDYDGLISYNSTGFYPIDWTPYGGVMSFEDEEVTGWSNSPIHKMIKDAGLDEC
jgi:hypothetical protein